MTALTRTFRRRLRRAPHEEHAPEVTTAAGADEAAPIDIAPNDPLLAYLQSASGAVDIEALELDSPALAELKAAGVKLAVPLVSQGELIGVLNLGPRLSEQEYSSDDRKLLDNLAAQAAPALRVGQLVRQQQAEAATRQRFEQELEVAKLIQQNFLPKQLPELSGWQVAAYYRPGARGRRRLLRRHPAARRQGRLRGRRRHRQGRPRRARDGRHPQRAARLRPAAGRARRDARARQRAPVPGHAGEDVRHLPVRRARPGDRPLPLRQRRPRPAVRQDRRGLRGAARPRHAARPDARHALRGEGDRPAARRLAAPALRRRRRGAQPRPRDVRLPAPQAVRGRLPRRRRADRPRARGPARPHRPGRRAGGRHHHGRAPALAGRGPHGQRRRPRGRARRVRGPQRRGQRAPGDRPRRARRWPASASPTAASSASRPRSARRR